MELVVGCIVLAVWKPNLKMGKIPSATFVACVCFLAFCVVISSAYVAVPQTTTTQKPGGQNHQHHHNHGQQGQHGHNHGQNQGFHQGQGIGQANNQNQIPPNAGKPVIPPPPPPVTKPIVPFPPTNTGRVPAGYTTIAGVGSYKFHAVGTPWNEAKTTCEREGTKMLLVNSNAESEAIKTLFKKNPSSKGALNSNHVWVGVQEKGKHGEFFGNNGQRLEQLGFLNWSKAPQQPNDPGNNDCVSYYSAGTLYDDACNIKYPFVCEV